MAESTKPTHVTLAVVFQVRVGEAAGAPLGAREGTARRGLGPSRAATSSRARRSSSRSATPGREGRRPRALTSRAARDPQRARSAPARVAARDGLPRGRAARGRPALPEDTDWHPVDRLPRLPSTTARSRWPAASGCGRNSRTRTSASRSRRDLHHARAARRLRGGARPRTVGDEPPTRARASRVLEADRRASRFRPSRRTAGRLFRSARRELEVTDQFAVLRPPG